MVGATEQELRGYLADGGCPADAVVHPCGTTWAMGFSWSSFVAQSTLLHCCRRAGLTDKHMLADDLLPPRGRVAHALATDDAMVFARGSAQAGDRAVRRLDEAVAAAGIQPHLEKNVDAEMS